MPPTAGWSSNASNWQNEGAQSQSYNTGARNQRAPSNKSWESAADDWLGSTGVKSKKAPASNNMNSARNFETRGSFEHRGKGGQQSTELINSSSSPPAASHHVSVFNKQTFSKPDEGVTSLRGANGSSDYSTYREPYVNDSYGVSEICRDFQTAVSGLAHRSASPPGLDELITHMGHSSSPPAGHYPPHDAMVTFFVSSLEFFYLDSLLKTLQVTVDVNNFVTSKFIV